MTEFEGAMAAMHAFVPELRKLVMDELTEADFRRTLAPADQGSLREITTVPPRLRRVLAQHIADAPNPVSLTGASPWDHLDERDLPWLEILLDSNVPALWVCDAIWRVAPGRALDVAVATPLTHRNAET